VAVQQPLQVDQQTKRPHNRQVPPAAWLGAPGDAPDVLVCALTRRYLGVGSSNRKNQWQARILHHGKVTHLGYYRTEEEAARVSRQGLHQPARRGRTDKFPPSTRCASTGRGWQVLVGMGLLNEGLLQFLPRLLRRHRVGAVTWGYCGAPALYVCPLTGSSALHHCVGAFV